MISHGVEISIAGGASGADEKDDGGDKLGGCIYNCGLASNTSGLFCRA